MNDKEFRAFLNLLMCSNPWPVNKENQAILFAFADKEANKRLCGNWIEAYHRFKE